jgi:hypothetical protein
MYIDTDKENNIPDEERVLISWDEGENDQSAPPE